MILASPLRYPMDDPDCHLPKAETLEGPIVTLTPDPAFISYVRTRMEEERQRSQQLSA